MAKRKAGQGGIQTGLPGMDWWTCKCGCGQSFLQNEKGRKREYMNDSHKKRAYRERVTEEARYNVEAEAAWLGWSDDEIRNYISVAPDSYVAWSGQWELYRREKCNVGFDS